MRAISMSQWNLSVVRIAILMAMAASATAQECQTRDDIPAPARTAVEAAARDIFMQASRGDINGMKANAIPSLQANFGGIASAITDNRPALVDGRVQVRTSFLLDTVT